MATDARGHTVPAASDVPSRNTLLNLALSVNDFVCVANGAAEAAVATAVSPTTSRPLLVYRTDARPDSSLEMTTNGSTWQSVPLSTGTTAYTVVLSADTTAPGMGVGGVTAGIYVKNGIQVIGMGFAYAGTSATSVGNGFYNLNIPVAVNGSFTPGGIVGHGTYFDSSVPQWYTFELRLISSTTARMQYAVGSNTALSNGTPGWNTNDKIDFNFSYLAA